MLNKPERDARVDPRPGDVLRKGPSVVTVVRATENDFRFDFTGFAADAPPLVAWYAPWLPSWRKWAKNAKVVKHA